MSNHYILRSAASHLFPVLIGLSLIVLYRGHNLPGGGFIGGLCAGAAFILYSMGHDGEAMQKRLYFHPVTIISVGLLLAAASAFFALFSGGVFFEARWLPSFTLPFLGAVHLGTPLIFDIGVYLTVIGFVVGSGLALEKVD